MSENIPADLYFLIRRIGDDTPPATLLHEEVPAKYGKLNNKELFSNYARLLHNLNPDDYDYETSNRIKSEFELSDEASSKNNMAVDKTTPLNDEEKNKIKRLKSYVTQKSLFKGNRSGRRGAIGGPLTVSSDEIEMLKKIDNSDSDLSYFDDAGKHLYVHHGWCKGDFEDNPTATDRKIALELEHNPLLGTVMDGGSTGFDEINPKTSSKVQRIPCLATPTPSRINEHMELLHGHSGTDEDHVREHLSGISNHTHPQN